MDWTFVRKALVAGALIGAIVLTARWTDAKGWTRFSKVSFGLVVAVCMLSYNRFFSPAEQAVAAYRMEVHDEEDGAGGDGGREPWVFTSVGSDGPRTYHMDERGRIRMRRTRDRGH